MGRFISRPSRAWSLLGVVLLVLQCSRVSTAQGLPSESSPASLQRILAEPSPEDAQVFEAPSLWTTETPPEHEWTFRYQTRKLANSATSYEFGVPDGYSPSWSPLSRLEFPINAFWHGFELGLRKPEWELHFEWLTPVDDNIQGDLEDRDWQIPGQDFTDLGLANERWLSG